jgi:hypothetical protein
MSPLLIVYKAGWASRFSQQPIHMIPGQMFETRQQQWEIEHMKRQQ